LFAAADASLYPAAYSARSFHDRTTSLEPELEPELEPVHAQEPVPVPVPVPVLAPVQPMAHQNPVGVVRPPIEIDVTLQNLMALLSETSHALQDLALTNPSAA
jgi:hypothetical protein